MSTTTPKKACIRCGSTKNLEEDHIIPKSKGGSDEESNKRILCQGCHDYRHTRDSCLWSINKQLKKLGTDRFNPIRFTMWIMRLGILEAFNTPEKIRERGGYMPYWEVPTTHYTYWYPQIKLERANKIMKQKRLAKDALYEPLK